MRASELLGRRVRDLEGRRLGRITELVTRPGADGRPVLVAVLVSRRRRGRLLDYDRPGRRGPWLLRHGAALLFGHAREVPWTRIRWE